MRPLRTAAHPSVTATDNHPFWVPELNEWLDATDLDSGDWLQTSAGTRVRISAVERTTVLGRAVHYLSKWSAAQDVANCVGKRRRFSTPPFLATFTRAHR